MILRGQTLSFRSDPFSNDPDASLLHEIDGAVLIRDGEIMECGAARAIIDRHPQTEVRAYGDGLIMAGFIDCHTHYPQFGMIASYGGQLLEWLERYTYPAEHAFADPNHARAESEAFLDECLRNGVTSCAVFSTVHAHAAEALFAAAGRRGMRLATGKTMMDRNAPAYLRDDAQASYDESKRLLQRWHGRDRLLYAVTPRFAITSTEAQLELAAALWAEFPTCLMQTHISENRQELDWIRELFPSAEDYLAAYQKYGLIGPGSIFAHGIHLSPREREALAASRSGIAHCPLSNNFMGSGLFDIDACQPIAIGLGTDVGGGTSPSLFAAMRAAYEVAQMRGRSLHPAKAFYLATMGGAKVMRQEGRIGNLAPGYEADLIVIDLNSRPLIKRRMARAGSISDVLFAQMILADDRAIRATYIGGRKVYDRDLDPLD